jgi:hypothetical protein
MYLLIDKCQCSKRNLPKLRKNSSKTSQEVVYIAREGSFNFQLKWYNAQYLTKAFNHRLAICRMCEREEFQKGCVESLSSSSVEIPLQYCIETLSPTFFIR